MPCGLLKKCCLLKVGLIKNLFWSNGSYEVPSERPVDTGFLELDKVLINWTSKDSGTIKLKGNYNYAMHNDKYYFLKPVNVYNACQDSLEYVIILDFWCTYFPLLKILGDVNKTNNELLLKNNLNKTTPLLENLKRIVYRNVKTEAVNKELSQIEIKNILVDRYFLNSFVIEDTEYANFIWQLEGFDNARAKYMVGHNDTEHLGVVYTPVCAILEMKKRPYYKGVVAKKIYDLLEDRKNLVLRYVNKLDQVPGLANYLNNLNVNSDVFLIGSKNKIGHFGQTIERNKTVEELNLSNISDIVAINPLTMKPFETKKSVIDFFVDNSGTANKLAQRDGSVPLWRGIYRNLYSSLNYRSKDINTLRWDSTQPGLKPWTDADFLKLEVPLFKQQIIKIKSLSPWFTGAVEQTCPAMYSIGSNFWFSVYYAGAGINSTTKNPRLQLKKNTISIVSKGMAREKVGFRMFGDTLNQVYPPYITNRAHKGFYMPRGVLDSIEIITGISKRVWQKIPQEREKIKTSTDFIDKTGNPFLLKRIGTRFQRGGTSLFQVPYIKEDINPSTGQKANYYSSTKIRDFLSWYLINLQGAVFFRSKFTYPEWKTSENDYPARNVFFGKDKPFEWNKMTSENADFSFGEITDSTKWQILDSDVGPYWSHIYNNLCYTEKINLPEPYSEKDHFFLLSDWSFGGEYFLDKLIKEEFVLEDYYTADNDGSTNMGVDGFKANHKRFVYEFEQKLKQGFAGAGLVFEYQNISEENKKYIKGNNDKNIFALRTINSYSARFKLDETEDNLVESVNGKKEFDDTFIYLKEFVEEEGIEDIDLAVLAEINQDHNFIKKLFDQFTNEMKGGGYLNGKFDELWKKGDIEQGSYGVSYRKADGGYVGAYYKYVTDADRDYINIYEILDTKFQRNVGDPDYLIVGDKIYTDSWTFWYDVQNTWASIKKIQALIQSEARRIRNIVIAKEEPAFKNYFVYNDLRKVITQLRKPLKQAAIVSFNSNNEFKKWNDLSKQQNGNIKGAMDYFCFLLYQKHSPELKPHLDTNKGWVIDWIDTNTGLFDLVGSNYFAWVSNEGVELIIKDNQKVKHVEFNQASIVNSQIEFDIINLVNQKNFINVHGNNFPLATSFQWNVDEIPVIYRLNSLNKTGFGSENVDHYFFELQLSNDIIAETITITKETSKQNISSQLELQNYAFELQKYKETKYINEANFATMEKRKLLNYDRRFYENEYQYDSATYEQNHLLTNAIFGGVGGVGGAITAGLSQNYTGAAIGIAGAVYAGTNYAKASNYAEREVRRLEVYKKNIGEDFAGDIQDIYTANFAMNANHKYEENKLLSNLERLNNVYRKTETNEETINRNLLTYLNLSNVYLTTLFPSPDQYEILKAIKDNYGFDIALTNITIDLDKYKDQKNNVIFSWSRIENIEGIDNLEHLELLKTRLLNGVKITNKK